MYNIIGFIRQNRNILFISILTGLVWITLSCSKLDSRYDIDINKFAELSFNSSYPDIQTVYNNGDRWLHKLVLDTRFSNNRENEEKIRDMLSKHRNSIDVNALNNDDYTALHLAVLHNHLMVDVLLGELKGIIKPDILGDINPVPDTFDPYLSGEGYLAPLHVAAFKGFLEVVRTFKMHDVNINVQTSISEDTPLHIAAKAGWIDIVDELNQDNEFLLNKKNRRGYTALHYAAERGHLPIVQYLIQKDKVGINPQNNNGQTALHMAVLASYVKIVRPLLQAGANVNLLDSDGQTALHMAVGGGNLAIVEALLQAGANVNLLDNDGQAALHMAVGGGNLAIVEALLQAGANVNLQDKDGQTALYMAVEEGHLKVVEALLQAGADINLPNDKGVTPLYVAKQNKNDGIYDCLIKNGSNGTLIVPLKLERKVRNLLKIDNKIPNKEYIQSSPVARAIARKNRKA